MVRVLAAEHGVGLGSGGDQDRARRQDELVARPLLGLGPVAADLPRGHWRAMPGQPQRSRLPEAIDFDRCRGQQFGKADAFLHRLRHLLVVEGVARRVSEPPAIGDRHPAPAVDQLCQMRGAAVAAGGLALGADRAAMGDEFAGHLALGRVPLAVHRRLAALGDQSLVPRQELFDLHRVIGERLGRGVDRGQPAADHDDREPHRQVGDAVCLGRPGQLQRHQKIRGLAHPGGEIVGDRDHRRAAGPGAQRHVVETQRKGAVDRDRAAKAHPAIHRELAAAFEQQAHDLQEILVPAHGDAVFGDPAKPGHDPVVEPVDEARHIADRLERLAAAVNGDAGDFGRQRLDLEPVDRGDEMTVVDQVMGEGEAGRPEADHQHLFPGLRPRQRAAQVERVPPGQKRIDLEAPGQPQHVLQGAGLDLRDIDRLLALIDAGLHAIVADAVPGRRTDRVVDGNDGQRAEAVAPRFDQVHLGYLFFERAAGEGDPEHAALERAVLLLQPLGAAVLALVVAPDAVIRLVERADKVGAMVGQGKPFAVPPLVFGQAQHRHALALDGLDRDQMVRVQPLRHLEQHPTPVLFAAIGRERGPGGIALRQSRAPRHWPSSSSSHRATCSA